MLPRPAQRKLTLMSGDSMASFDRMRGMLMRAAEIRESEQQQIFDTLDEIHARLAALDALGTIRKRLSELPDRTEVSVLAERLDETVAKLDAQEAALSSVAREVEALPDKLAKPFAQLDGRLDGVGGRMEGIAGRMEGLDDRLAGLHKRLDELDHRLDRHEMRLETMPMAVATPIKERIDGVERTLREQLDGMSRTVDETTDGLRSMLSDATVEVYRRLDELAARPAVDPTDKLNSLAQRLDSLTRRLEALEKSVAERFANIDRALSDRPDTNVVRDLLDSAKEESIRRNAGHLDEAMATFAEVIMGRVPSMTPAPPPPRPTQRRTRKTVKSPNGASASATTSEESEL